ncbi:MAG: hypothetical protein ACTHOD_05875 [Motilibacteraceae bacterium]
MHEDEPEDRPEDRPEDQRGQGDGLHRRLERRLDQLEGRLDAEARSAQARMVPAWRRATRGEQRWPASLAVAVAVALQVAVPGRLTLSASWLLPAVEAALLVAVFVANPTRISAPSRALRLASLCTIAVASLANAWSAAELVRGLVRGTEGSQPAPLLTTGALIWLTNVIVFGLWYWELDRGGPAARAGGLRADRPDFLFPQMATPGIAPAEWEPGFADYLYVSFTNAMAFSPTDTMPLSRWAKLTMLTQSLVSLATVALVIARAVNILR